MKSQHATGNAGLEVGESAAGEIDLERAARAVASDSLTIGGTWIVAQERRDLTHKLGVGGRYWCGPPWSSATLPLYEPSVAWQFVSAEARAQSRDQARHSVPAGTTDRRHLQFPSATRTLLAAQGYGGAAQGGAGAQGGRPHRGKSFAHYSAPAARGTTRLQTQLLRHGGR